MQQATNMISATSSTWNTSADHEIARGEGGALISESVSREARFGIGDGEVSREARGGFDDGKALRSVRDSFAEESVLFGVG